MTIAVTGSSGQLGSELCRQLGGEAGALDLPGFDLTDRAGVLAALRSIRPAAVVNTAAFTLVDRAESELDLCRRTNAEGVAHLAGACRELDCPLVQVSTDYVFGGDRLRAAPYRETDEPRPQGVYGRTKLEGERHAAAWPKHYVVRTCGLYGRPGTRSAGNFVETMLHRGAERPRLRVVNDQHCTPTYVPHVARAILFLMGTGAYGTYHVVNAGRTTWYEFAKTIFREAGMPVEVEAITTAEYGARAPRPSYSLLSTEKYHALPGCPVMPSWQQAIRDYLAIRLPRDGAT
jgi:dTDP-4-dehydrorhamnose reductase